MKIFFKKILKSSLFKSSGVYTVGSIINNGVPFLLLPILTRYLTPEDYGLIAMFGIVLSIVGVFTGLSVHGAIQRVYYEKTINFKKYVFNCLLILVSSSVIVLIIVMLFRNPIFLLTKIPANWLWLIVVMSFFLFVIQSLLSIYQAKMQAIKYMSIQITQTLLNVILSILLVVFLMMNWQGRILAQAISIVGVGLFSLYILTVNWSCVKIDVDYIKHALKFGIPLIPHTLGGLFIAMADRVIIEKLLGLRDLGLYSVGIQLCMGILVFHTSFNRALNPWVYRELNKNELEIRIKLIKFTYVYFILLILGGLLYAILMRKMINVIVGQKYSDIASLLYYFSLGTSFSGMYNLVAKYIFYSYKTMYLTIITFIVGLINIVLTYIMVNLYYLRGAAISYLIVNMCYFIFTWIVSARVFKMPWLLWRVSR